MYFRNLIKEASADNPQLMMDFVMACLNTVSQFHLFHLLTKNPHHHDIMGEFYEELEEELDEFSEFFLGENDLPEITPSTYQYCVTPSLEMINAKLNEFDGMIIKVREELQNGVDGSMIDAINDIKELVSKLRYKLKMTEA